MKYKPHFFKIIGCHFSCRGYDLQCRVISIHRFDYLYMSKEYSRSQLGWVNF